MIRTKTKREQLAMLAYQYLPLLPAETVRQLTRLSVAALEGLVTAASQGTDKPQAKPTTKGPKRKGVVSNWDEE